MTKNQFDALCSKYLIDPSIALENEDVRNALKQKDTDRIEYLLKNNF